MWYIVYTVSMINVIQFHTMSYITRIYACTQSSLRWHMDMSNIPHFKTGRRFIPLGLGFRSQDTTPLGRVLNRFSQDMALVDLQMPRIYEFTMQHFTIVVLGTFGASMLLWPPIIFGPRRWCESSPETSQNWGFTFGDTIWDAKWPPNGFFNGIGLWCVIVVHAFSTLHSGNQTWQAGKSLFTSMILPLKQ